MFLYTESIHERQKLALELHGSVSQALYGIVLDALIFALRPESLQTEGLVAALERLVQALGARHELEVRFEAVQEPEIPLEAKEALYRVTQEATNNIAKHARARHVSVRLSQKGNILAMEISVDGAGFDPDGRFQGHLGLHSMRKRVGQLAGTINLESAPGQGTRIQVTIPMKLA